MYLFQYLENIVLLQVISDKLFVGRKGAVGKISAISVEIGAEFFVYGVPHKSTPAQYQYLLFLQKQLGVFIKREFHNGCRDFVDTYLDMDGGTDIGMIGGNIAQPDS